MFDQVLFDAAQFEAATYVWRRSTVRVGERGIGVR